MKELIIGGARSGKSGFAQRCAEASGFSMVYLATATAGDAEMAERIDRHRAQRGAAWDLIEEPLQLAGALLAHHRPDRAIVVDCLTLWVSNCLHNACWEEEKRALLAALGDFTGHIIFVTNETGMGIIPMGNMTRRFVDESGWLHQELAARCDRVTLMVAGLPLVVKPKYPGDAE